MRGRFFILAAAAMAGCADMANVPMQPYRPYYMTMEPISTPPQSYTPIQPPVAFQQHSVTAMWTGAQEPVTTVTGLSAWRCQYNANGQTVWRIFEMACPSSISVK